MINSGILNSIKKNVEKLIQKPQNSDLTILYEDKDVAVYRDDSAMRLVCNFRDIAAWTDTGSILLSINGIDGTKESIAFNSTIFPNLLPDSWIERIIIHPWSRNATTSHLGKDWRMNVITNNGQIYHNFPSRAVGSDGTEVSGDYKRFEESAIWELPERWRPVKTNAGDDAALIATGKYRYYPALPDSSYEFHPVLNTDASFVNTYSNGGFPAVLEKTNELGETVKFARFYQPDRAWQQNSFGFMGGFEATQKLSLIGTYKSNSTSTGAVRICVFITNDGGRNWFCRYEFGAQGELINSADTWAAHASTVQPLKNLVVSGFANAGASLFNVIKRSQYVPDSVDKEVEKTKMFKYSTPVAVTSIAAGASDIVVTTSTEHGYRDGEIILFEKQSGAASNVWDWLVNTNHTATSAGDGVLFKVKSINATSFRLMESIDNPHNNLRVRHIHSINRCKDGFVIGTGETYPEGWVVWVPIRESDSFYRKYPWDSFSFIRLTSTKESVQRILGAILRQDADNTLYVGVDNEMTDLGDVTMPAGRTDTFKRSSNGVWKGKLTDIDSQAAFQCVFESPEACYFFKEINGIMIYIGQLGHVGISVDGGKSWKQCHINKDDISRFGGVSYNGYICIENYLIKAK